MSREAIVDILHATGSHCPSVLPITMASAVSCSQWQPVLAPVPQLEYLLLATLLPDVICSQTRRDSEEMAA